MKVNNRSSGDNYGNHVQIGKARNVNFEGVPKDRDRKSNQTANGIGALVASAFLIFIIAQFLGDQAAVPFTEEHGTRPTGATDQAVLAVVGEKVRQCAKAVVIKQENCPQSVAVSYVSDVRWTLYGDPIDGGLVAWHDDRFHVRGAAVMTVEYAVVNGRQLQVEVVGFQAEVLWKEGRPVLDKVDPMNQASISGVHKHDPALPADQIAAAVRDAFDRCIASGFSPMPPECPRTPASPYSQKVTWKLGGDPLLNTRQTFDPVSGLTHVIGSYAATARYRDILNAQVSAPVSGSYDALIISDADGLRVLQVRDA